MDFCPFLESLGSPSFFSLYLFLGAMAPHSRLKVSRQLYQLEQFSPH